MFRAKGGDVVYDYLFARLAGLSYSDTLGWLRDGYRIDEDIIVDWKLYLYDSRSWQPDEESEMEPW